MSGNDKRRGVTDIIDYRVTAGFELIEPCEQGSV